jgi:inorganic pyrophosphatase
MTGARAKRPARHAGDTGDVGDGHQRAGNWVEAIIEIPRGSRNKYEYDHQRRIFRLDRVLYSSMHYPTDYGFIEGTLAGDGDPLDILVIVEEPTFPGCHLRARPIGTLNMQDEQGQDEKILAVPLDDPHYTGIHAIEQLQQHWTREIAAFFRTYRELQGVEVEVRRWDGAREAWRLIDEARQRSKHQYAGSRATEEASHAAD